MSHTFLGLDFFSSTPASSGHGVWTGGIVTDDNDDRDAASAMLAAEAALNRTNWNRWHMINQIDGCDTTYTTTIATTNQWRFGGNMALVAGSQFFVGLGGYGPGDIDVGSLGTITIEDGGYINIVANSSIGGLNFTGGKALIQGEPFLHGNLNMGIPAFGGLRGNIGYGFTTGRTTTGTQNTDVDHILAVTPGVLISWTLSAPLFGGTARNRRLVLSRISVGSDAGGINILNTAGTQIAKLNQGNNVEGHLILEWITAASSWHVVGQSGNVSVNSDLLYP